MSVVMHDQSEIAVKYAQAFLAVHASSISLGQVSHMWSAVQFLQEHRMFLFYLSLTSVSRQEKQSFLQAFCNHFSLVDALQDLCWLMIERKHIFLLTYALEQIYRLYKQHKNITDLQIITPIALSDDIIASLSTFFKEKSKQDLIACQHIDPALIAGVRLQSDFYLWEDSIAQKLRLLRQTFNA